MAQRPINVALAERMHQQRQPWKLIAHVLGCNRAALARARTRARERTAKGNLMTVDSTPPAGASIWAARSTGMLRTLLGGASPHGRNVLIAEAAAAAGGCPAAAAAGDADSDADR